jgi:hypothetical protein
VLRIYRLIPRTCGFIEWIIFFVITQISRYSEASFSVHGVIRHKSACFWVSVAIYAMYRLSCEIWHWVVCLVPEKKATHLKKKWGSKSSHSWKTKICCQNFKTLTFGSSIKSGTFLNTVFLDNEIHNPALNFIDQNLVSYLSIDTKSVRFSCIGCRHWWHSKQSLLSGFGQC